LTQITKRRTLIALIGDHAGLATEGVSMLGYARLALWFVPGLVAAGCSFAPPHTGKSPLSPFKPGLETSAFEVLFVRHPYEQAEWNQELWEKIDETPIAGDARQDLAQNGFRAGIFTGQLPGCLEQAISTGEPANKPDGGESAAVSPVDKIATEPLVRRRTLHARSGQRAELLASGVYEQLPLLMRDGSETSGRLYAKAQCVLAVTATPLGDHRVRISMVPELQYGEPRREIRGDDGVFRFDSARPKVVFDKLAIDVELGSGQAVILGTRPDKPGSVGHYFFTEPRGGQLEQKLMVLRFDGTRYDNLLFGSGDGNPSLPGQVE
jgi:hypothetical protein